MNTLWERLSCVHQLAFGDIQYWHPGTHKLRAPMIEATKNFTYRYIVGHCWFFLIVHSWYYSQFTAIVVSWHISLTIGPCCPRPSLDNHYLQMIYASRRIIRSAISRTLVFTKNYLKLEIHQGKGNGRDASYGLIMVKYVAQLIHRLNNLIPWEFGHHSGISSD